MFYFDLRPYRLKVRYAQVRSKYGRGHKYGTNIGGGNKYGIMGQVQQARIQGGLGLCLVKTKEQFLHDGDTAVFDRCANISAVIAKRQKTNIKEDTGNSFGLPDVITYQSSLANTVGAEQLYRAKSVCRRSSTCQTLLLQITLLCLFYLCIDK